MQTTTCLAFDLGASSGRLIAGTYDGNKLTMEEIHRFPNDPVEINGHYYWDFLRLFLEIKNGIMKAKKMNIPFQSIGIDTWGVDYALLDKNLNIIGLPFHYRDKRLQGISEHFPISYDELYKKTGIQHLSFNTIYQLYSDQSLRPHVLNQAEHLLFMPDLLDFFLTNNLKTEYTNASTSQLLNVHTKDWDLTLCQELNLPGKIFKEVIQPGTIYGYLHDNLVNELKIKKLPVIAVGSHDTASAVAGIPFEQDNAAYLILGTWSLLGTELEMPIINLLSKEHSFTNEGGVFNTIRFLKNINGTFLLQQLKKSYSLQYHPIDFADIIAAARSSGRKHFTINPDDPLFTAPQNIVEAIKQYCVTHQQGEPQSLGEISLAVYNGLTHQVKCHLDTLEKILGKRLTYLHIVGGGIQDEFLCQHIASHINKEIIAGPIESSAMGNLLLQLYGLKRINSLAEGRAVINNSVDKKTYLP